MDLYELLTEEMEPTSILDYLDESEELDVSELRDEGDDR